MSKFIEFQNNGVDFLINCDKIIKVSAKIGTEDCRIYLQPYSSGGNYSDEHYIELEGISMDEIKELIKHNFSFEY